MAAWHRFGLARPSRLRLALSLRWVVLAGVESVLACLLAAGCPALLGRARGRRRWRCCGGCRGADGGRLAGARRRRRDGGRVRAAARVLPDAAVAAAQRPDRPRGLPEPCARRGRRPDAGRGRRVRWSSRARRPPGTCRSARRGTSPASARQNTYTAISHETYKEPLLHLLRRRTPVPRPAAHAVQRRADHGPGAGRPARRQLAAAGPRRLLGPQAGCIRRRDGRSPAQTAYAVLWTRRTPVPGAGGVAWTSPGTSVSAVHAGATSTTFHVDRVPPGAARWCSACWTGRATRRRSGSLAPSGRRLPADRPPAGLGRRSRRSTSPSTRRDGGPSSAPGRSPWSPVPRGPSSRPYAGRVAPQPGPIASRSGLRPRGARSVATTWSWSLVKVSSSSEPWVATSTRVAWLRAARSCRPGQPALIGLAAPGTRSGG